MSSTLTEIIIIVVLIFANGILAMSEIALVSARKARLQPLADDGDKKARAALEIANSPNDFLSTVQIGITLVGIFAGAYGGATVSEELAAYLKQIPEFVPYADAVSLGFVVALITYFSLIVGELVPKRLALHSPERIARIVAMPMQLMSRVAKPLVFLLSGSTNFVLNALKIEESEEHGVTEAEIHVLVGQATEAGVFEESEQEMVSSVLGLSDRSVRSIMTPRIDILWIEKVPTEEELIKIIDESFHTRFPVADGSLDAVVGIIDAKKVVRMLRQGLPRDLTELIEQPAYIPENFTVLDVLELFRDTKQHIALVIDEHGGLQGLVTREDVFQAIVGDLPTHDDQPKWEATEREDGSWLLDGQVPLNQFKKLFSIDKLPDEEEGNYHTLAGFILYHLERIPAAGDHFQWSDLRIEVVDMDRHRIDKVLVERLPSPSAEEADTAGTED